jgi:hypothetical protein
MTELDITTETTPAETTPPVEPAPPAPAVPNVCAVALEALALPGTDFDLTVLEFARCNPHYGETAHSMTMLVLNELCEIEAPTFAEYKYVFNVLNTQAEYFYKTGCKF